MSKYRNLVECTNKTVMSGGCLKNTRFIITPFIRDLLPSRSLKIAKNENINIG